MSPCAPNINKILIKQLRQAVSIFILTAFIATSVKSPAFAQSAGGDMMPRLPVPGVMVHLSPEFTPAYLQGITIHPDNALQFDFLIHKGDQNLEGDQKQEEYKKLVKYFLASLTIPDEDQWVNLSPYEKDRIIKDSFGKTEMGRDLLAEDYLLKQITSSLIYPEDGLGKKFWGKIYERAWKEYHTTQIPVNTFNKVWIVPNQAFVYESGNTAYIFKSHLKVMLEEDYLSLFKHQGQSGPTPTRGHVPQGDVSPSRLPTNKRLQLKAPQEQPVHALASQIIKEIILPELEKEVNEGKNFANLRQIYSGMILATWYKKALKESLLGKVYADKARLKGVDQDPKTNEEIYQRYLKAFQKGVFNYIKEDVDKYTNEAIPRKYFSGGFSRIDRAMVGRSDGDVAIIRPGGPFPVGVDISGLASDKTIEEATVAFNPEGEEVKYNPASGGGMAMATKQPWTVDNLTEFFNGKRILIISDNKFLVRLVQVNKILKGVDDIQIAEEFLKEGDMKFDAVIYDINMFTNPKNLAGLINTRLDLSKMPMVFLMGNSEQYDKFLAVFKNEAFLGLLMKPFDPLTMFSTLADKLEAQQISSNKAMADSDQAMRSGREERMARRIMREQITEGMEILQKPFLTKRDFKNLWDILNYIMPYHPDRIMRVPFREFRDAYLWGLSRYAKDAMSAGNDEPAKDAIIEMIKYPYGKTSETKKILGSLINSFLRLKSVAVGDAIENAGELKDFGPVRDELNRIHNDLNGLTKHRIFVNIQNAYLRRLDDIAVEAMKNRDFEKAEKVLNEMLSYPKGKIRNSVFSELRNSYIDGLLQEAEEILIKVEKIIRNNGAIQKGDLDLIVAIIESINQTYKYGNAKRTREAVTYLNDYYFDLTGSYAVGQKRGQYRGKIPLTIAQLREFYEAMRKYVLDAVDQFLGPEYDEEDGVYDEVYERDSRARYQDERLTENRVREFSQAIAKEDISEKDFINTGLMADDLEDKIKNENSDALFYSSIILGVNIDAAKEARKSARTEAFRRLSRKWHPDVNRSSEDREAAAHKVFKMISNANDILAYDNAMVGVGKDAAMSATPEDWDRKLSWVSLEAGYPNNEEALKKLQEAERAYSNKELSYDVYRNFRKAYWNGRLSRMREIAGEESNEEALKILAEAKVNLKNNNDQLDLQDKLDNKYYTSEILTAYGLGRSFRMSIIVEEIKAGKNVDKNKKEMKKIRSDAEINLKQTDWYSMIDDYCQIVFGKKPSKVEALKNDWRDDFYPAMWDEKRKVLDQLLVVYLYPAMRDGNIPAVRLILFFAQRKKLLKREEIEDVMNRAYYALDRENLLTLNPSVADNIRKNISTVYIALTGKRPGDKAMVTAASPIADKASLAAKGGIDLNSANLHLQIKRDGRGVPLPLAQQDMGRLMQIQGFVPEIIEIKPAVNLPILSELQQKLQSSSV
ncbi:MAG: hypothetical protein HQL12_02495 [Candidatus Omnitrophica bacterium]|nr:hypothetical protein [Candidatus Omnitrophota bacterium]